jgi:ribosome maturation factor RimP
MTKKSKKQSKPKPSVNSTQLLETLIPIVEETAENLKLTVLETTFTKERGSFFLRIFIFNPDKPVDHSDCANLTRALSEIIDNSDLIPVHYSLEVSSPGVNRKLKNPIEYRIFKDKEVKVTLKKPLSEEEKNTVHTGILIGLSEDQSHAIVKVDNTEKTFNLKNIKNIQLEG